MGKHKNDIATSDSLLSEIQLAKNEGLPHLQAEARNHSARLPPRNGRPKDDIALVGDRVTFPIVRQIGDSRHSSAKISKAEMGIVRLRRYAPPWGRYAPPWGKAPAELVDDLSSTTCRKNRCLAIRLASEISHFLNGRENQNMAGGEFLKISELVAEIRPGMYPQSKKCHGAIGELHPESPLLRDELKIARTRYVPTKSRDR